MNEITNKKCAQYIILALLIAVDLYVFHIVFIARNELDFVILFGLLILNIFIIGILPGIGDFRNAPSLIGHNELIEKLDEVFNDRESLSDEEFYTQYFEMQGIPKEIPIRVRKIFEEQFDADFSRVKNTDDWSQEMQVIWGVDSMIDVEIIMAVEEEFGVRIEDEEAEKMKSIQDIVACVWNKKEFHNHPSEDVRQPGGG